MIKSRIFSNNFAIFRGSKTGEGGANDFSSDMEFSASGTIIRDKDLVTFALMWVVKLISEEHKDMKIIIVGGWRSVVSLFYAPRQ